MVYLVQGYDLPSPRMIYLFPDSAEISVFGQNEGEHILKPSQWPTSKKGGEKDVQKQSSRI